MIRDYRILILDDEIDICFLLGNLLKKENAFVKSIHSIESFNTIDLNEFQILFIDNNLQDGSGFDLIEKILQAYNHIKIIAISAFDTISEREHALEKGAHLFLGKPFSKKQILNIIDSISNHEL